MSARARFAICAFLMAASIPGSCSSAPPGPIVSTLWGSSWIAMTVGGTAVLVDAPPTIEFSEDGRISGTTGANGYFGPVTIDEDSIAIGQIKARLFF